MTQGRRWTRRGLLRVSGAAGAAAFLAACGGSSTVTPTSAPASAPTAARSAAPPAKWGMTADQAKAWADIEAAAKNEGRLTYYSLGSISQSNSAKLKAAFQKDYPDIELTYLYVGNSAAMTARLTTELEAKTYVADVYDTSLNQASKRPEWLAAFIPPVAKDKSVKWLTNPIGDDKGEGLMRSEFAQYVAIWINTDLVKAADAPKSHLDITDPKWKGKIMWRTPWEAGAGVTTMFYAKKHYGPEWIKKMQTQDPSFEANQDQALLKVARGEYAIGLGMAGRTGQKLIDEKQPLKAVFADDFVITIPSGTQLLKTAPHPNAARVFCNWMLAEAGQTIWREMGQFPSRADVAPTDTWMVGIANAKGKIYTNVLSGAVQGPAQEEAKVAFKK